MTGPVHADLVRSRTRRMIMVAAVGSALATIPVWLVGGFAVQITEELGLSEAEFGVVVGSFMAVSAVLSVPGGVFVRRQGWVRPLRWVAVATAAACIGIALTTGSWLWLVGCIGLAGASHSLGQPSANLALVQEVPVQHQGLAFGIKQSSIPIGTLVAGLSVPALGSTVGWRWAFVGVSVACVGLYVLLRDAARPAAGGGTSAVRTGEPIRPGLRGPLFMIALGGGLGTAASNSLGAFTVLYAASLGIEPGVGGVVVAVGSIANIVVRITAGRLSDRRRTDRLRWVVTMLLLGSAAFVVTGTTDSTLVFTIAVVAAFMTGWGWNGLYHLGVVDRYRTATATATGIIGLFLSVGGAAGPVVVGVVISSASFTSGWLVVAGFAATGACMVMSGSRWHARRLERPDLVPTPERSAT